MATRWKAWFPCDAFGPRKLWKMYLPLLAEQTLNAGIGALTTAMLSRTGVSNAAALGLANPVLAVLHAMFTALMLSGTILIAYLSQTGERLWQTANQLVRISFGLGILVWAGMMPASLPILRALYPGVDARVLGEAAEYLRLSCCAYLPFSVFCALAGIARGLGKLKLVFVYQAIINLLYLLMNCLWIIVFGLGLRGAGISNIVSRGIAMAVAGWIHIRSFGRLEFGKRQAIRGPFRAALRLYLPILMEQLAFYGCILVSQVYIGRLSIESIAAQALLQAAQNLILIPATALTMLLTVVVGQLMSRGLPGMAVCYTRRLAWIGRGILLGVTCLAWPARGWFFSLYSDSALVASHAVGAYGYVLLPLPLWWSAAQCNSNCLRATGHAREALLITLFTVALGRILSGFYFTVILRMGISGFWIGQGIEYALGACAFRYVVGKRVSICDAAALLS